MDYHRTTYRIAVRLVDDDLARKTFTNPSDERTEAHLTGRVG